VLQNFQGITAADTTTAVEIVMQEDCNLVAYDCTGAPVWASNSANSWYPWSIKWFSDSELHLQADGNLVIYADALPLDKNPAWGPIWTACTPDFPNWKSSRFCQDGLVGVRTRFCNRCKNVTPDTFR